MVAAGNVFVNNAQGIRVLNSSDARIYHNTFLDSPVVFDRNERSAQGDHFGWHPQTGPDVDEREGHVFEGNLLVASEGFNQPLLRFEQPSTLCGKLTRPMTTRVDGNAYVRATAADEPLVIWSPVRGKECQTAYATLEAFRKAAGVEAHGKAWMPYHGIVFRSVDMRRFELAQPLLGMEELPVAPEALNATGWTAPKQLPGAYPSAEHEVLSSR